MTSIPILIAILLVVVVFLSAMKRGVVKILAGGLAAALGLAVFFLGMNFLPSLAKDFSDIDLAWPATLAASAVLALVIFLAARFALHSFLRVVLGPDGFLHFCVDGILGGIISLVASLTVVFAVIIALRVAGTALELNYAASLGQPGIEKSTNKFPAWPLPAKWRDQTEAVPLAADVFDRVEPFSRRRNRNLAGLLLLSRPLYVETYLEGRADTAPVLNSETFKVLAGDEEIARLLQEENRIGLLLNPKLQQTAADPALAEALEEIDLKKVLSELIDLIPDATSSIE